MQLVCVVVFLYVKLIVQNRYSSEALLQRSCTVMILLGRSCAPDASSD